ncbi:MAG: hypothetical protein ACRDCF_02175 [Mycoplasmoidaceae bacterium]
MNKKIKLGLLGTLIASSALALTFPIVSCSSSTEETPPVDPPVDLDIVLTADTSSLTNASNEVTKLLKQEMDGVKTYDAKKSIAHSWKIGSPLADNYSKSIISILKFNNDQGETIDGIDVIENITFNSIVTMPDFNETITGPEIKVNFIDGYTSKDDIIIQTGSLGNSLVNLVSDPTGLENATKEATSILKFEMDKKTNRSGQEELLKSWAPGKSIDLKYLAPISNRLSFTLNGVKIESYLLITSITYHNEVSLPDPGQNIVGPLLRVNFVHQYNLLDFFIEIGDIGIAK